MHTQTDKRGGGFTFDQRCGESWWEVNARLCDTRDEEHQRCLLHCISCESFILLYIWLGKKDNVFAQHAHYYLSLFSWCIKGRYMSEICKIYGDATVCVCAVMWTLCSLCLVADEWARGECVHCALQICVPCPRDMVGKNVTLLEHWII